MPVPTPFVLRKPSVTFTPDAAPATPLDLTCFFRSAGFSSDVNDIDTSTFCAPTATQPGKETRKFQTTAVWSFGTEGLVAVLWPHSLKPGTITYLPDASVPVSVDNPEFSFTTTVPPIVPHPKTDQGDVATEDLEFGVNSDITMSTTPGRHQDRDRRRCRERRRLMGFRAEDPDMADVWAIEDMTGQTMEQFVSSGSAKIPYILAWRNDVRNGRPGLGFDQWQVENAHLTIEQVAADLGYSATPDDPDADPEGGRGPYEWRRAVGVAWFCHRWRMTPREVGELSVLQWAAFNHVASEIDRSQRKAARR